MNLTPRQLRLLRRLLAYHEHSPRFGRLLKQLAVRIIGWSVIILLFYIAIPVEQKSKVAWLGIGVLVGFTGTGLASIRLIRAGWPVYDAIIDWSKAKAIRPDAVRRSV